MAIVIRPVVRSDFPKMAEMRNEGMRNGFNKYTGRNTSVTKKDIGRYQDEFDEHKKRRFLFVAEDSITNKIVGIADFHSGKGRTRHRGEMGWSVRKSYSGRGIGTKLVRAVIKEARRRGFRKVEAEAAAENVPSVKLAKRCGFRIEGRKKAGLLLDDGRYVDSYIFGKVLR